MLFTRIQLDDFSSVMSRYMERLEEDARLDGVSRKATIGQVDWMLMAAVNIAAMSEYGSASGVVRKALAQEGQERRRQQAVVTDEPIDMGDDGEDLAPERSPPSGGDGEVPAPTSSDAPITLTFTNAVQLVFAILSFCLAHPNRLQGIHSVLNPYITVLLTFLATVFRQPHVGGALLSAVPWQALVDFVNSSDIEVREEIRLAGGPPLPEDWAVRGEEWVGRRVYERGFWKGKGSGRGSGALAQPRIGERFQSEIDVLLANFDSAIDISEGVVDEVEGTDLTDGPVAVNQRRWKRVAWAAGVLAKHVYGLRLEEGKMIIDGALAAMLAELEAEKPVEEERRAPTAEEFEEELADDLVETDSDNDDDPELTELRVSYRMTSWLILVGTPTPPARTAQCSRQESSQTQARFQKVASRCLRLHNAYLRHQCTPLVAVPLLEGRGRRSMECHHPPAR